MSLIKNPEFLSRVSERMKQVALEKDTRRFDAATIAEKIKSRVIGQDLIADTIASFVARKAARRNKKGTIANILISGPTSNVDSGTFTGVIPAGSTTPVAINIERSTARLDGQGGRAYGTLPKGVDAKAIIDRAYPV